MSTYKVTVRGEILPGYDSEAVKTDIARLFKLDTPEQAGRIAKIFSGAPLTVKKGLDHAKAQAYQQAIQKAGMACDIVPEVELTVAPVTPPPPTGRATFEAKELRGSVEHVVAYEPDKASKTGQGTEYNPYHQPQADLATPAEAGDFALVEPQKLGAGSGWSWIKEGFYYFKQNPVTWILACIVMLIIFAGLSFIPLLNLAGSLLGPVFTAGFMLGCQKVYQGDDFTLGDLFSGFQTNAGALVLVGLINLLMTIAVIVVAFGILIAAMGMDGMALLGQLRSSPDPAAILVPMLLMVLLVLALLIPVMMAYMFAPALVAIHGVPVMRSFALSFKGCLRNMIPFFTYSILVTLLFIAAVIPIGLGLLILIPVLICSLFAAYRQIYTDSVLAE